MKKNVIAVVLLGAICLTGCSATTSFVSKEKVALSSNKEVQAIEDTFIKKAVSFYAWTNSEYTAKMVDQDGNSSEKTVTGKGLAKMDFDKNTNYQFSFSEEEDGEITEQRIEVNRIDNKLYLASYNGNKVNECKAKNSVEYKTDDFSFKSKKEVQEEIQLVLEYLEVEAAGEMDIQPIVADGIECYNAFATLENGLTMEVVYSEFGFDSIVVQP